MSAYDCIDRITGTYLVDADLKYCLVDEKKRPIKPNGDSARPNKIQDFVELHDLLQCGDNLFDYAGVGISIQASNICAIDVDHCFKVANDISSISETAKDILEHFKDFAYCEFSFSGTGLRILFRESVIDNYSDTYYIKNEKNGIEYYQCSKSFRYVTITGNWIYDNDIGHDFCSRKETLSWFLNKYMKKPQFKKIDVNVRDTSTISLDDLLKRVRYLYLTNSSFQDLWFGKAPGSGKDESERDFRILLYLYENVTQNPTVLRELFESSPFYKSKDKKHVDKWLYQNYRYFEYVFKQIERGKVNV